MANEKKKKPAAAGAGKAPAEDRLDADAVFIHRGGSGGRLRLRRSLCRFDGLCGRSALRGGGGGSVKQQRGERRRHGVRAQRCGIARPFPRGGAVEDHQRHAQQREGEQQRRLGSKQQHLSRGGETAGSGRRIAACIFLKVIQHSAVLL